MTKELTRKEREAMEYRGFLDLIKEMGVYEEMREIARVYGVNLEQARGPLKYQHIVRARHQLMRFIRERFNWSYTAIGDLFNRDHTTVIAGVKSAMESESEALSEIRELYQEDSLRADTRRSSSHENA